MAVKAFSVSSSTVAKCKTHRLDVAHYREDGTCHCYEPATTQTLGHESEHSNSR